MNVLITGGFGYLGQRLGRSLHKSGFNVFLASRKYQQKPKWLKNGEAVKLDWNNISSTFNNLPNIKILIHAAGTNASFSFDYPDLARDFNEGGTAKLLKNAITNKVSQFIYLSTAHVYASPLEGLISEDTKPSNEHPYATSNLLGEQCVLKANLSGKISGRILRISNCFGAPDNKSADCWDLLVNDICLQAVKLNSITLKTNGTQSRDFLPISEFCRIVEYLIVNDCQFSKDVIFNVGGQSMTILEMANLVKNIFYMKYNKKIDVVIEDELNRVNMNKFQYKMNWLKESNFQSQYNPRKEIEDLLDFCKTKF